MRLSKLAFTILILALLLAAAPSVSMAGAAIPDTYVTNPADGIVNGDLNDEQLDAPFFKEWSQPTSGHPANFTYGWVRNDANNLYVAIDFAPANAQPCTPGARQIALYDQPNFSGACAILDSGHYLESQAIGLANDTVSSIKVGAGAAATLCWHNNFEGTCESFYNDDNSLADNEVRDNNVSSVRVFSGDTNCNPGTGEVALFKGG